MTVQGSNAGQPKLTRKGEATRARIVAAASQLMFERGVAVTGIDDVKAAAGVSSSQLYHYFADKQALISAVVAYQTEDVLWFHEFLLDRLDSLESLRAWRDLIVELKSDRGCIGGCPIGSLASELSERDPASRYALATAFDRWERGIRAVLERMRDRGELSADADLAGLGLATLAALQGGLLLAQVCRSIRPLEVALDEMLARIESHCRVTADHEFSRASQMTTLSAVARRELNSTLSTG
jgi:TetR/AcrR family transcriptional regulator, transcriptional repressor for nem operon